MTTLQLHDPVAVWLEHGEPVRLVWRGRRYVVTDQPTPISEDAYGPGITHPLTRRIGVRCQGTDEDGLSLVFDLQHEAQGWVLAAVYD